MLVKAASDILSKINIRLHFYKCKINMRSHKGCDFTFAASP